MYTYTTLENNIRIYIYIYTTLENNTATFSNRNNTFSQKQHAKQIACLYKKLTCL